jgi:hypothetical protein
MVIERLTVYHCQRLNLSLRAQTVRNQKLGLWPLRSLNALVSQAHTGQANSMFSPPRKNDIGREINNLP